jgi:hypothetical protein
MSTTISNENGWRLETLEIRFQDWGEFKGKYTGAVKFQNKEREAFVFNLSPERCAEYLTLIKEEVGAAATSLGNKIIQSLNLLPQSVKPAQIGEEIPHESV